MHIELVRRVCELDGIDAVWLDMTVHVAKKLYIAQVASDRLRMAEVAVASLPRAGVTQLTQYTALFEGFQERMWQRYSAVLMWKSQMLPPLRS